MINANLEGSMKINFTTEDILEKYKEISKLNGEELDRTIYKVSHDINGSYGRLTSIVSLIDLSNHEVSNKKIIEEIQKYGISSKNAVSKLTQVLLSKKDPITIDEIYSNHTSTSENNIQIKEYASIIRDSALQTRDKKPLILSVIKEQYQKNIPEGLKELLDMGDMTIDKIISTHNNFFSKDQNSKYSKKNFAGEHLTSETIYAYANSPEAKLIGKINTELNAEFVSREDIFSEYILPILDNIKDHAWDKTNSEFDNDIYNRENTLEKKCLIRTKADDKTGVFKIYVSDNGYGIHPSLQEKIFSQGATGRKNKEEHGIGLNILKDKIRNIGGNISFKSEQGLGTKFTIEIPYRSKIENEDNTYVQ